MISNAHYLEHTHTMFDELGILKLADISLLFLCINTKTNICVNVFVGTFTKNQEVHHYNTRFAHHYRSIKYKSDKMKYSIKVKGLNIWKEIPQKIESSLSLHKFKKSTKLMLLNQYSNNTP